MPNWDNVQGRAKKLIDEGVRLLKTGAHDAGYLAETTAQATKLHISLRQNHFEKYKVLYELGKTIYNNLPTDLAKTNIDLTNAMIALISRVRKLDEVAKGTEKEISRFSIVRKEKPPSATHKTKRRARP